MGVVNLKPFRVKLDSLLKDLLYNNPRLTIWNKLRELMKQDKYELSNVMIADLACESSAESMPTARKVEFSKLYAMHVEYALKSKQVEKKARILGAQLDRVEEKGMPKVQY